MSGRSFCTKRRAHRPTCRVGRYWEASSALPNTNSTAPAGRNAARTGARPQSPAVDAFEKQIAGLLEHPAFREFGSVIVTRDEARSWASAWALNGPTKEEADVMAALLFGQRSRSRQLAGELILAAASYGSTKNADQLRGIMSGPPSSYTPPGHLLKIWEDFRRIQMRQLFRLTLEALFYWTLSSLEDKPQSVDSLVELFLSQVPSADASACARDWLKGVLPSSSGPTELITAIEVALDSPSGNYLAPTTARRAVILPCRHAARGGTRRAARSHADQQGAAGGCRARP
jgi:hypothetical protein